MDVCKYAQTKFTNNFTNIPYVSKQSLVKWQLIRNCQKVCNTVNVCLYQLVITSVTIILLRFYSFGGFPISQGGKKMLSLSVEDMIMVQVITGSIALKRASSQISTIYSCHKKTG